VVYVVNDSEYAEELKLLKQEYKDVTVHRVNGQIVFSFTDSDGVIRIVHSEELLPNFDRDLFAKIITSDVYGDINELYNLAIDETLSIRQRTYIKNRLIRNLLSFNPLLINDDNSNIIKFLLSSENNFIAPRVKETIINNLIGHVSKLGLYLQIRLCLDHNIPEPIRQATAGFFRTKSIKEIKNTIRKLKYFYNIPGLMFIATHKELFNKEVRILASLAILKVSRKEKQIGPLKELIDKGPVELRTILQEHIEKMQRPNKLTRFKEWTRNLRKPK